jgi:hypothetical protein
MKRFFWFIVGFALVFSLVFGAYAEAQQPTKDELYPLLQT